MNTTTKILIGIGLVSVSGAIFYFYKNYSDESEIIGTNNDENKDNKVDTATTIDDELMNPQDQKLLDNLEADNILPSTSEPDDNGNDYEDRPVETRRTRTDIGDRRSSGTRSSLNPSINPSINTRSSRTRSSRTRTNRR